MSNIHFTFNKYNCLEMIAVCRAYVILAVCQNPMEPVLQFLFAIPFKARVCISKLKVQRISETCIYYKAERDQYRLNLFIAPRKRDVFGKLLCMWAPIHTFNYR